MKGDIMKRTRNLNETKKKVIEAIKAKEGDTSCARYQPDYEDELQFSNKVGLEATPPSKPASVKVWNDSIPARAYRLCLLGLSQEELAVAFGVSVETIEKWIQRYPKFRNAVRLGTQEADGRVVHSLYKKATGYAYYEDQVTVSHGNVIVTRVQKFAHPETTAAIFWLKNRQRQHWSDVQKVEKHIQMEITSNDGQYDLSDVTDEELAILEKIGLKDFKIEN